MITSNVTIVNKLGLHARAAGKLSQEASRYESDIIIDLKGRKVEAKSIMAVMMLAAAQGSEIVITCDGRDEKEAMGALIDLIERRFDEEE